MRGALPVLIILLAVAAVAAGLQPAYAQSSNYQVALNTTRCGPGAGVLVTIAYTGSDTEAHAGEVLELHFTNATGAPADLKVVKVFEGSVEVVGKGYAIVTLSSAAKAVFSMKAPAKPGAYYISVHDITTGELLAEATLTVSSTAAPSLSMLGQPLLTALVLALILAALIYYFLKIRPM